MANRQRHDQALKHQARQVFQAHGAQRASEVTGVPPRTIFRWAATDGWRMPRDPDAGHAPDQGVADVAAGGEHATAPPKRIVAGWQPVHVLRRLAQELEAELDDLAQLRQGRRHRDARDVAVTVGILVDKAMALAKQVGPDGGRTLDPAQAKERLHRFLDVIEDRRRWEREHGNGQPG